jgi:integrase
MDSLPKGVQRVVKRRRDGTEVIHYYLRFPRTKLPDPSDPGFLAAIARARQATGDAPKPGTFAALVLDYKRSPGYLRLEPNTRKQYDRDLERVRELGPVPVADIKRRDILTLRDALALHKPQAANHLVMVLSVLMGFAVEREWREANPLARIKRIKGGEYKRWPEAAIQYALEHLAEPFRRAVLLALYTGQREGDCVAMKWSQYDGSAIAVVQEKTGAAVWVPCHRVLRQELDRWRTEATAETVLVNHRGEPWRKGSFATRFCTVAGEHIPLEGLVFHGLRKAAAARLAEAGCSTHEIAAITGHASLGMVEHYTKEADQRRRATAAITKLELVYGKKEQG